MIKSRDACVIFPLLKLIQNFVELTRYPGIPDQGLGTMSNI